jgi:polyphosphate kinase
MANMQKINASTSGIALLNRELGALEFNSRVLAQAEDPKTPLLERLRFVCIVSSNMDEFFEIRMSGIKEQLKSNPKNLTPDGLKIKDAYEVVASKAHELVARKFSLLQEDILPKLEKAGVKFFPSHMWTPQIKNWARDFFQKELIPLLTPIALDPAHPFPKVINKSLNFLVTLEGKDSFGRKPSLAVVQAPRSLPRVVPLPEHLCSGPHGFVLLSSFIQAFVPELFQGMTVTGCHQFRVTRNSDLFVSEDDITDLRSALQGELPTRHLGAAVRLEVTAEMPGELQEYLQKVEGLNDADCYRVNGPVNLVRLVQIPDLVDIPKFKFKPHQPKQSIAKLSGDSIFEKITNSDILLHHPYESFDPVLQLLQEAARDPKVLAIKQTVYRTGEQSLVMDALMEAARNGKEVTVVVELLARFDEQTNIGWAAKLEAVGAHVVYGVVGHKCHAKMLLIVRQETIPASGRRKAKKVLKRYAHLGTGNYHPRTAKIYSDFGLMTANQEICEDMHHVFMQLTGTGGRISLKHLWQSPFTMHPELIAHIRREARNAKQGKKAHIMAKMNSLLEPTIIQELYKASQAGVKIDLIIRGVCALQPGVPGLSENIKVKSIIGRFLEHHRIYYFYADGTEVLYLSSADWMDRNLFRRVEVAFPVLDPKLKTRVIKEGFQMLLKDNTTTWHMNSEGHYHQIKRRASSTEYIGQKELVKLLTL